jgi:long-chain acyl-CoA synthetase
LQNRGIGKGTKIGLFLPNCLHYLVAYYAILKVGATVVNFNPLYAERELKHQIDDSGVNIMVTLDLAALVDKMNVMLGQTALEKLIVCRLSDNLPPLKAFFFPFVKAKDIASEFIESKTLWCHELCDNDGKPSPAAIDPDNDLAVLQYTGGTTGISKGAMLTHANVSANVEQAILWFQGCNMGEEKIIAVLPFFHVFAMTAAMNMGVRGGFEIIVPHLRFDLKTTLKTIHDKKPTFLAAVPAIFAAINNNKDAARHDLKSLKYCISGGAPLPVEVKKEFEKLTGCTVVEGYGLSETSPVVCVNPIFGANKAGSIGLPLPRTDVKLFDIEGKGIAVPQGERGELCIKGLQVMKGYWGKAAETENVFRDGWLRTGDVAIMDSEGYFFIVDRIKDMIITNGYNVYPRNVEEAIYLHPSVEECIVAGIPDPVRGEMVKAWIKLRDGKILVEDELKEFLVDKLSKIEIPKIIEFRTAPLPKTLVGKLSRKDVLAEEREQGKTVS